MAKVNLSRPHPKSPSIRAKELKGIAPQPRGGVHPKKIHPNKANSPDVFGKGGLQKAAEGLHGIVASTPRSTIVGAARFAATVAGVSGPVIETAAAALGVLGEMYAGSPSKAAAELQHMALTLLVPNKGGQV